MFQLYGNATSRRIVSRTVYQYICRGAFKSRAAKIKKAVGGSASVEINKEKPGRGNFVVKVDGKPIVELLAMVRNA